MDGEKIDLQAAKGIHVLESQIVAAANSPASSMTGSGGWPGDDDAETQVMALPPEERQVLAALAVVRSRSSLGG
jgi:hypothetical protein